MSYEKNATNPNYKITKSIFYENDNTIKPEMVNIIKSEISKGTYFNNMTDPLKIKNSSKTYSLYDDNYKNYPYLDVKNEQINKYVDSDGATFVGTYNELIQHNTQLAMIKNLNNTTDEQMNELNIFQYNIPITPENQIIDTSTMSRDQQLIIQDNFKIDSSKSYIKYYILAIILLFTAYKYKYKI